MTDIRKHTNNDLNIAMLGHKRIPSREGGVEVVVEELAARMILRGNAVTCYNRSGHHVSGSQYDINEEKEHRGIRLKKVPTIDYKGLAAVTSSLFASIAAAFGPYDIVHIHAEGPAVFCWLPRLAGKKVIVTIHGLDWQRAKWSGGIGSRYIHWGEKMAVKYAHEIIVLSEGVMKYFEETYGRKTWLIPNGVSRPEPIMPNLIRKKWGLEKDSYILYLGRLVPEKGIHYLVEAFRNIRTTKKLVIAGGASDTSRYKDSLKALAAGDNRIIFTDFVQGILLQELYSNAYIYSLPSDLEGMPLSLLEGMSYGNCCLVSDIPECVDVVGCHAVTFRHGDTADLQDKLQKLCDDMELVNKHRDTADLICEKYNWDDTADRTLDLYLIHMKSKKLRRPAEDIAKEYTISGGNT